MTARRAANDIADGLPVAPRRRGEILPLSLPPRGLTREQAAAYIGVSVTLFDDMIADGRMPGPKRINARTVWDLRQLDSAFDQLPTSQPKGKQTGNPWDD